MGYPMTYGRVVKRNSLEGDYDSAITNDPAHPAQRLPNIRGDLRRLEADTQDDTQVKMYAYISGATEDQVRTIFRALFAREP